jgi:glycyl-tRNA synthetase beta chain
MAIHQLLLEVGVEEVPDWMLVPAMDHLRVQVVELLKPLGGEVTLAEATTRRLAIIASGLGEREQDQTQIVKGPPLTAPAPAVEGFARKQGVTAADLSQEGGYYQFTKVTSGRAATEILAEKLPAIIMGIPWPKTMLWPGKGGARFIRPIRWIVCLLGDAVVPFAINGVATGSETYGHRQLGARTADRKPQAVPVTIESYEAVLDANGVILRAAKRRAKLVEEVGQDNSLVDLHVYLNEWPAAFRGTFDPAYLDLPEEVLVTVMRYHQKYFAVHGEDGKLKPEFIAVMNRKDDPDGLIRHGNERVLRARFNDARFFYEVDQKRILADRVEDLKAVTFHKEIGNYYEKTLRIVELCDDAASKRAALLAKADLTTEMVKEFTELQGMVGGRYAAVQGESPEVAQAIYEQYRPLSMDDAIPASRAGQMVALADKIDTLREMFRIGQIPSGSKDPFALRRAAQGVIRILAEGELSFGLVQLADDEKLREFLLDRVRYYFRDVKGFAYDAVNAVLAAGADDLKDVALRLAAIQAVRQTADFEPVAAAFKRIKNILSKAEFAPSQAIDPALLEAGPEADLHAAFVVVKAGLSGDYGAQLTAIASLRPVVDAFFNGVMVNVDNAAVRQNRLTLLHSILSELSSVADFSEIVTAN